MPAITYGVEQGEKVGSHVIKTLITKQNLLSKN